MLFSSPRSDPWEHVIGIGAGALAGSYLADWEVSFFVATPRAFPANTEIAPTIQERTIKETTILEQNRERKFTGANLSDKE